MSWVARAVEQQLAQAAANGELDAPTLQGRPLDLDSTRGQGWWADGFVARELSHDRREVAAAAAAEARARFWHATSVAELSTQVEEANAEIERANVNLIEPDRLPPFDPFDIEQRWRSLRRA